MDSSGVKNTPVIILCGGEGTRLREETEYKPKPMVVIGGQPILWHIMKHYSTYGYKSFILCLGYRGNTIKEYFLNRDIMDNDLTIRLGEKRADQIHRNASADDWEITFAETGLKAQTGARIKKAQKYVNTEHFIVTYGDGISNIDLGALMGFHLREGRIGTLSGVHPPSRFGVLGIEGSRVASFAEKPKLNEYINGGFYVFKREMFDRLKSDDSCVLEHEPLGRLATDGQLSVYKHDGFWHMMDTYKDYLDLNRMWDEKKVPWKVW